MQESLFKTARTSDAERRLAQIAMECRPVYVLNFGAGLNSTTLLVYLVEQKAPLDLVIFSDTGNEHKHTYTNIEFYSKWSLEHDIEFVILNGGKHYGKTLYQYCWDKKIIPSRQRRDCTTKFKKDPIRRYLRERYGRKAKFVQYFGITYEEIHRVRDSDVKFVTHQYPLVDAKITRQGCIDFLKQRNLPVPPKSGCIFCPFTPKKEWIRKLTSKNPQDRLDVEASIALEMNATRYPKDTLSSVPLTQIQKRINSSKSLENFMEPCDSGYCWT